MAFYSVRVDENGKEIDTTRKTCATFRKFYLNSLENETNREILNTSKTIICSTSSSINKNDKNTSNQHQFQSHQNSDNNKDNNNKVECDKKAIIKNTYKTVRYVNSATFIEKDSNQIKSRNRNENANDDDNGNGNTMKNDRNNNEELTNRSHEINDQQYQSQIVMESIPLLELNSNESFPSSVENLTYSYRKVCEVTKMITKPDAYKEWLLAKRFAKSYEMKRKFEEQKRKEEEKQLRKRLAEERFRQWLTLKAEKLKKEKQKKLSKSGNNKNPENNENKSLKNVKEKMKSPTDKKLKRQDSNIQNNKISSDNPNETSNCDDGNKLNSTTIGTNDQVEKNPKTINFDNDIEREEHIQSWLKRKLQKLKEQKEKFNERAKLEKELERKRRDQASIVYKEWLKTAPYKPKPVPLNQGLFTLKGCISNLYVNPNPWVSPDSTE